MAVLKGSGDADDYNAQDEGGAMMEESEITAKQEKTVDDSVIPMPKDPGE
ncbi:MAG TPA: hypothetical protein VJ695_11380 [Nitrososphaera sp.]|nr:hypothetical protein [Nitrososphaera sp.]